MTAQEGQTEVRRSIEINFGMCDVCGKKDGKPGHDCDGGEALRKAAHELFAPTVDLIERTIAKAGTGVLRGVFEVAFERDALLIELAQARREVDGLREALRKFGRHDRDCETDRKRQYTLALPETCGCGLSAALTPDGKDV